MNNPLARLEVNRSLDIDPALMGVLAFLTHGYLGMRVWRVCNRSVVIGGLITLLSCTALGLAIGTANPTASVASFQFEFWFQKEAIKVGSFDPGTSLVVFLDGFIATILCVYLLKQKTKGREMRRLVRRIVVFAINTGLASSILSIVNIVTFLALPNTMIFLGTNFIFTKVYANCLLANLNARKSLRGKGYLEDGTLSLNLSALRGIDNASAIVYNDSSTSDLSEPPMGFTTPFGSYVFSRAPWWPGTASQSSEENGWAPPSTQPSLNPHSTLTMEEQDPWHLTVVLLEGLRLMRPEKAWRPIITLEVDKHHAHETTLGVDGQNINQKEVFKFHDVDHNANVEIKVWHRSQSKKKKRKVLVASACHCLGELVKKQSLESKLEIRLQCQRVQHKSVSSRGRPQKGAALHLKLRPPSNFNCERQQECYESSSSSASYSDSDSDDGSSVATVEDDIPIHRHLSPEDQPQTLRRRKVRGYVINSDDGYSTEGSFIAPPPRRRLLSDDVAIVEEAPSYDEDEHRLVVHSHPQDTISFADMAEGLPASDLPLPLYTEKLVVPPDYSHLTRGERVLVSFTLYGEMCTARTDAQFEPIFRRLQAEWTFIGGLLVALAAVNTAVFSISPDSIFQVDSYARSAIAASSIASGLGITCDAWFLLRYTWADLSTFITRAKDVACLRLALSWVS
ncbi:hypothetical protein NLJ89_g7326 [Agrocybe chaxingu]|uniref:C2 domain-containing protein n=1 Tax=Agrocybe chaxingu TaxID=84603 RepID=A0A9W8MVJ6_9AGAR|nr:hypothetical protein NLJ89_g7326 [Agrocybe chaxingu]